MTKWNLKDHEQLYGEPDEYGDTDYEPFDIDKWNTWMLVHHVATSLGARYFKTEDNRNSILAPLSRNFNYDADNYAYDGSTPGTPHISPAYPSESYELYYGSWFNWWTKTLARKKFFKYSLYVVGAAFLGAATATTAVNMAATYSGALSGMTSLGALIWNIWFVVGAVYLAAITIDFIASGIGNGFNIENVTPPGSNPKWPKTYQKYNLLDEPSNTGTYALGVWDNLGSEWLGSDNWDVRYSWINLNLNTQTPVDLVSFSKGFDKKTGDLIRLNLTNELVTSNGPNTTARNDATKTISVFVGWPKPYAYIDLMSKYQVAGDSLTALPNFFNFAKDTTLATYTDVENYDNGINN
jgi:hypothetical protein